VFGPPIPEGASFPKSEVFADFLLAKGIFKSLSIQCNLLV
jgi:hypothetical protein